jgi:hypothetical protein
MSSVFGSWRRDVGGGCRRMMFGKSVGRRISEGRECSRDVEQLVSKFSE